MELGDADDDGGFRLPPSPDDRLWRHPSELGRLGHSPGAIAGAQWRGDAAAHRRGPWWAAVTLAAALGSIATFGALAASGVLALEERRERPPVIRQAASTPTVGDAVDPLSAMATAEATLAAVVRIEVIGGSSVVIGSGVLVRADGYLMTSAHVVRGAEAISVVMADGRRLPGALVGFDAETDIAVLRLLGEGPFPVAALGSHAGVAVGQAILLVGASQRAEGPPVITAGTVKALGREVRNENGQTLFDLIETSATMAPGSSGGAMIDAEGRVLGIATAYAVVAGKAAEGYAVSIDVARAVAADIAASGAHRPAWLGVRGLDQPDGGGLTVVTVVPASPAEVGGLKAGDILFTVNDRPVDDMSSLRIAMHVHHPGDPVKLGLHRGGQPVEATVVLGTRPAG